MNDCKFIGRLTADPKSVSEKLVTFTIAVQDRMNKEKADFIDCKAFNQTADFVKKFFSKGKPILVSAQAKLERWEKDGNNFSRMMFYVDRAEFLPINTNDGGGNKNGGGATKKDDNHEKLTNVDINTVSMDDNIPF